MWLFLCVLYVCVRAIKKKSLSFIMVDLGYVDPDLTAVGSIEFVRSLDTAKIHKGHSAQYT